MTTADDCPNTPAPWAGVVFSAGLGHLGRYAKRHMAVTFLSHWLGGHACDRMAADCIRIALCAQPATADHRTLGPVDLCHSLLPNVHEAVGAFLDDLAFEFGDFRISIMTIISALVVIGVLLTLARIGSTTTATTIRRNEDISPSMQVLAVKAVQITLYGFAFFIGINTVGIDLSGLAILTGAIGVGLGFGLQKVISNLVSGVIILLDKSIKPGDVISLGETFGWIQTLGARYASVITRDGKEYLIPNEDLITNQVVNWSHSNDYVRLDIFFGTAYSDDPHKVRELAIEAATTVERVLDYPKRPVCHIVGFGDSSVDYILRFWIKDPTGGLTNIRGGVYLALWDAFKANNISIPFPQREVRMLEEAAIEP